MYERRRQTDCLKWSCGIVQAREQEVDGVLPNFVCWLRNHRQSRFKRIGPFKVIEGDEGNISRNLKATLSQRD